jgi:hypothetical protein
VQGEVQKQGAWLLLLLGGVKFQQALTRPMSIKAGFYAMGIDVDTRVVGIVDVFGQPFRINPLRQLFQNGGFSGGPFCAHVPAEQSDKQNIGFVGNVSGHDLA